MRAVCVPHCLYWSCSSPNSVCRVHTCTRVPIIYFNIECEAKKNKTSYSCLLPSQASESEPCDFSSELTTNKVIFLSLQIQCVTKAQQWAKKKYFLCVTSVNGMICISVCLHRRALQSIESMYVYCIDFNWIPLRLFFWFCQLRWLPPEISEMFYGDEILGHLFIGDK